MVANPEMEVALKIGVTTILEVMLDLLLDVTDLLDTVFFPLLAFELIVLVRLRQLGWARLKEMLGNGGAFALFLPAGILGVGLWAAAFDAVDGWIPWSIRTTGWTVLLAIVVADFLYYWEHRLGHELRLLWDLYHSVHHSSRQYDQTTNLRLGVFDGLLSLGFSLPMVIVGFSAEVALLTSAFVIAYQTWLHTEVIGRMPGWFEAIFNTPSHHRAHHGAQPPYLDVNYGGVFILWDRLFGTFQAEQDTPAYGLTDGAAVPSPNPFRIQFGPLLGLVRDLRRDRCWRHRWARLWNRPGWRPSQPASPQ